MAGTAPFFFQQLTDNNGKPLSNGKLYSYVGGSTNLPKALYYDKELTTPTPNPLIADASGNLPQYFITSGYYKFEVKTSNDVLIASRDWIDESGSSLSVSDHKVATSLDDTNPDYLMSKVIPGDGMDIIEVVGATRQLEVSSKGLSKVSMGDSAGYLDSKFSSSSTISWNSNGQFLTASVNSSVTSGIGKVKSTSADTNDYLFDKFVASNTVSPSLSPDNKHISFDVDLDAVVDNKVKHNYFDDIPGYLNTKIKAGAGITITSASDDVNGAQLIINSRTNSWKPMKYITTDYTIIDTDDTIVVIGGVDSFVNFPNASAAYEGRKVTIQGNGYTAIVRVPTNPLNMIGDDGDLTEYGRIDCLSAKCDDGSYIWIRKRMA